MKTIFLGIALIGIAIMIGLIVTNSNPDKNRSTERVVLDTEVNQRSEPKQLENLSMPPKSVPLSNKMLSDSPLVEKHLPSQHELKNNLSSKSIKTFGGQNHDDDPVKQLEQAFYQNEPLAIQTAINLAAQCSECFLDLTEILEDEGGDNQLRIYAAQALIKSGSGEAARLVLKEIMNAKSLELPDLEDGLKQAFIELDSVDSANLLMTVLLDEQALDLNTPMPDDIEYMVSKVIRKMSARKVIADSLRQQYQLASSPENKEKLLNIGHPEMNAMLVIDAHQKNQSEQVNALYARLMKLDDQAVIDGMMLIAKNQTIFPLEEIAGSAYEWVSQHKNESTLPILIDYLSDFDSTSEERIIAVYGITAAKENENSVAALVKAWEHSEEPIVRDHLKALATMPDLFSNTSK